MDSISEKHGIELINDSDLKIYSIGISTAGKAEIEILKQHPNAYIIATTIDEIGLEQTRASIEKENLHHRIELKLEDISKPLEYQNETFDYIYARLVLHYLDNDSLNSALKEIYRILKKDGKFYVVVRSNDDWEATQDGASYNEQTGMTKYPIERDGATIVKYCSRRLHSTESIKNFLETANFKIQYIKTYEELLSKDYNRENMNSKLSGIIEVLVFK